MNTTFSPKDPSETIYYGVDFNPLLDAGETVSSATASIRVLSGTDATPSAMLSGSVVINAGVVSQLIIGGVVGCVYQFSLSAVTSGGQTFIESAPIRIIDRD
jgi:hypothetical protein